MVRRRRPDSIEGRLVTLLEVLATDDPAGGWDTFLDGAGGVRWAEVVVGAWSDGNIFASALAHDEPLHGVFYLSGPPDEGWPAGPPYLAEPFATPPCASFGIHHALEEWGPGNEACWDTVGLPGPTVSVDDDTPPYGGSQRYTTMSWEFDAENCNAHAAVARDECMDESALLEPYRHVFCALGNRDRAVCP